MAVTTVNLTGDIADLLGGDFDSRRTKVWIETNVDGDVVIDSENNKIRLGDAKADVATDGTFAFTGLVATNSTTNPTGFQYRVWVDYATRRPAGPREKWNSGWFSLTATLDLADVVAEQYVPPTYVTQATQQLDAHAAGLEADLTAATSGATASADAAAASATEAGGYAQQARDISNIDTTDDAMTAVANDPASDFRAQQSASYVGAVVLRGAGIDPTGTADSSAAIRAKLAAAAAFGAPAYLPEGTHLVSRDGANNYCLAIPAGTRLYGPGRIKLINGAVAWSRILSVTADDVTIEGITLDGNRANVAVSEQTHGIICTGSRTTIRGVTITGTPGDGICFNMGASDAMVVGSRITDAGRNGVTLGSGSGIGVAGCRNMGIIGNHIEADVQPIDSEPETGYSENVRVIGNHLESVGNDYAITCTGSTDDNSLGWTVADNAMVGAVYVIYIDGLILANNRIDATASTALNAVHTIYNSRNVTVANNEILAAPDKYGVTLSYSSSRRPDYWKILGNTIRVSGTGRGVNLSGCGPVDVSNNVIHGGNIANAIGVRCQSTASMPFINITGNELLGFDYGVQVVTSSTNTFDRLIVTGNHVDNREASPVTAHGIYLSGTASQFLETVMHSNTVGSVYANKETTSTVLVRRGNGYFGTGSPEGVVTAPIGTLYTRRDGGAGTSLYVKESGTGNTGWVASSSRLTNTATLDFPSIAAGGSQELTITVTGAALGDSVYAGPPSTVEAGLTWAAYVSAANIVKVRATNVTAAAIDPASATWRVTVVR